MSLPNHGFESTRPGPDREVLGKTLVILIAVFLSPGWSLADERPSAPQAKSADTQIKLFVRDGRQLSGYVDHRTDEEVLWLRIIRGSVVLSMGVTWDLVQEVQIGAQRHSAAAFREIASTYALAPAKRSASSSEKNRPSTSRSMLLQSETTAHIRRVHALELRAEVVNWDRDAESDGIRLHVMPLDAEGRVLAVEGVLSIQLIGRAFVSGRDDRGFPVLGQWSQRVRSTDFRGHEGAVYQLATHRQLDHDLSLLSIGMVEAQLTAFGQGHFEAVTPTRLRSYNPIREQLDEHHLRYDAFGRYRARHW